MYLNPYSIPLLASAFIFINFGFFVVKKNPRAAVNISFAFICLTCTIWLFFYFLAYNSTDNKLTVTLFKIGYCGVSLIPAAVLQYTVIFLRRNPRINILPYTFGLISCVLILTSNYIIDGTNRYFWGYYPLAGKLHPYFLALFISLSIWGIALLFLTLRSDNISNKNQIKYMLMAFFAFSFASFDFVPNYGIEIYPFGYLPTFLFLTIVAYAIIKHHLMDINIIIRKGFIYSVLAAFISTVYLIFVLLAEKLFQGMIGYTSLLLSTIYVFIIAMFLNPVKNRVQHLADRLFLGKDPVQIAQENELLKQEIEKADRLKAVAAFASGMAHEIKNPLTAIKTFSEYLPQKLNDQQFLHKFSNIVNKEVSRIDNLVHQLLEFSRPAPLKIEEADIYKLLDDTLEFLSSDLLKHNIMLNKDYVTHNLITRVDSNKIKQAFLNLFINAIEAMPFGGTLSVCTSIRENQRGEKSAEICVQDTGCGISEKDLPHIFEPFHSTKEGGTGLGLSVTYGIIKEHSGNIKVESKINQGTRFMIELLTGEIGD